MLMSNFTAVTPLFEGMGELYLFQKER